jgi:hypothetical protein
MLQYAFIAYSNSGAPNPELNTAFNENRAMAKEPFSWNYKPAEKHCWLIFCKRKILF